MNTRSRTRFVWHIPAGNLFLIAALGIMTDIAAVKAIIWLAG